jgi:hypothetical protein
LTLIQRWPLSPAAARLPFRSAVGRIHANREADEPGRCLAHDPAAVPPIPARGKIGCHSGRATGITTYPEAAGALENAQAMMAHESPSTTKLFASATR